MRLSAASDAAPQWLASVVGMVLIWRAAHGSIAVALLAAIAHVWRCALTGRRDRWLRVAVVALTAEGTVVGLNGGDCPLGPIGERVGDEVPLFELVLPPRAAKLAVPALGIVAAIPIAIIAAGRGRNRQPL